LTEFELYHRHEVAEARAFGVDVLGSDDDAATTAAIDEQ
jgi:hypothetical protein